MSLGDQRQDVRRLVGEMELQPLAKQRLQFERQPQQGEAGRGGTRRSAPF